MQIRTLHAKGEIDENIYYVSRGPDPRAHVFNRCYINGFLFRGSSIENFLTTQNSGVLVKGDASTGNMDWYGVLRRIICLDFHGENEVMLFQCDWFDVPTASKNKSRGYNKDQYGVVDIDMTQFKYSDEPFILSTQAEQVFYVKHAKKQNWCSALRMQPRNLFSMPEAERTQEVRELDLDSVVVGVEDMNLEQQNANVTTWSRDGLQGESVDATVINQALATAMPEPMYNDLFDEFEDPDDTYIDDGVVPPFISTREGEDSDDDFFV
jgi:hypothetical protein